MKIQTQGFRILLYIYLTGSFLVLNACGGSGDSAVAPQWQGEVLIEMDDNGSAQRPQIAVDVNGNAVAVWMQHDGTRYNIWANRYEPAAGWGTAEVIETGAGDAQRPQVAIDMNGNAIVVWYQYSGSRADIWSNRYVAGTGWEAAELLETVDAGDALYPKVVINVWGNAAATWLQSDGVAYSIWASQYTPDTGWQAPVLIENDDTGNARSPRLVIDDNDNIIVAWSQSDGTVRNLWSNRYIPGLGWGSPQLLESDDAGHAGTPAISMDADGNALVVWAQHDGARYNMWSARFEPATGWANPELIENDDAGDTSFPDIAMNANGTAIAVWKQYDGARTNIHAARYMPGTGWETDVTVEDENGNAGAPEVAMNNDGVAVVVWHQTDGTVRSVWGNRYEPDSGWDLAQILENDDTGDAELPQTVVDSFGNALAIWTQDDGARNNILVNHWQTP